jgi:pimeloyl-ACP methyl ester carboxylesterase
MPPSTLTTTDGVPISAYHDPGPTSLGIVVAHGLTGSWRRSSIRRAAEAFRRVGGVVAFDFRGHGRSGGHSTVGDREVLDLAAAVALGAGARLPAGGHGRVLDGRRDRDPARRPAHR